MASEFRSQAGLTLVELAVVLFVLGLAAWITLPAVGQGIETLELRTQVAQFSAFLRYGREQAITRRAAQEVRVDPDRHQLLLIPVGSDTPTVRRHLSTRVRVSAEPPGARGVTFAPEGFSSGGSFRLEGQGRRVYRVTVDPVTGRVSNRQEAG